MQNVVETFDSQAAVQMLGMRPQIVPITEAIVTILRKKNAAARVSQATQMSHFHEEWPQCGIPTHPRGNEWRQSFPRPPCVGSGPYPYCIHLHSMCELRMKVGDQVPFLCISPDLTRA